MLTDVSEDFAPVFGCTAEVSRFHCMLLAPGFIGRPALKVLGSTPLRYGIRPSLEANDGARAIRGQGNIGAVSYELLRTTCTVPNKKSKYHALPYRVTFIEEIKAKYNDSIEYFHRVKQNIGWFHLREN